MINDVQYFPGLNTFKNQTVECYIWCWYAFIQQETNNLKRRLCNIFVEFTVFWDSRQIAGAKIHLIQLQVLCSKPVCYFRSFHCGWCQIRPLPYTDRMVCSCQNWPLLRKGKSVQPFFVSFSVCWHPQSCWQDSVTCIILCQTGILQRITERILDFGPGSMATYWD